MSGVRTLALKEYVAERFSSEEFPESAARLLYRDHKEKVEITPPCFKTGMRWELRSLGWVGTIPVGPDLRLILEPKIPLENLFGMLEYAFDLRVLYPSRMTSCATIEEFYERLALLLARSVLERSRRGLYRAYISCEGTLPTVRGRLAPERQTHMPASSLLHCHYQEHTADNDENRILAWTLHAIVRSALCGHRSLPMVRQAGHVIGSFVSLQPYTPRDCVGRLYNRLNDDYAPMHALCRFFLEGIGPTHRRGDRGMLPFLVDMALLFERFVAQWLARHLPSALQLRSQERVVISRESGVNFVIDLVLYDRATGAARAVLDTKYKAPSTPSNDDIYQILAYATRMQCREAWLVYPTQLARPLDVVVGEIRVRSVVFDLAGDLDEGGMRLIDALLGR